MCMHQRSHSSIRGARTVRLRFTPFAQGFFFQVDPTAEHFRPIYLAPQSGGEGGDEGNHLSKCKFLKDSLSYQSIHCFMLVTFAPPSRPSRYLGSCFGQIDCFLLICFLPLPWGGGHGDRGIPKRWWWWVDGMNEVAGEVNRP